MVFKVPQLCGSLGSVRASSPNFIWSCPAKLQINVCFTTFIIVCVKYAVSVDALCKGVCWRSKDSFQGAVLSLEAGFLVSTLLCISG